MLNLYKFDLKPSYFFHKITVEKIVNILQLKETITSTSLEAIFTLAQFTATEVRKATLSATES